MAKQTTEPSLKSLREQLERAQLEAEIKSANEPLTPFISSEGLKPRARVFVYSTPFLESKATMLEMTASLRKAMGDENIAIVNISNGNTFHEL